MCRKRMIFGCLVILAAAWPTVALAEAPEAPAAAEESAAPPAPATESIPLTASSPAIEPPANPAAEPAAPATAEAEPPPPPPPSFPYAGIVTGDAVYIRSGPGLYYYPLLTLNRDTVVDVLGEANGWLALRPPESVYGLVRKGDVTLDPSGMKATVSAPRARVYTSSPAATARWCVMATLLQGDTLQVRGTTEDDMVRVAPPEGARAYVSATYVAAAGGSSSRAREIAMMQIEPPKPDPLHDAYKKAGANLKTEAAKPLAERNYDAIVAVYKEVTEKTDKPYLKKAAEEALARITALRAQQDEYAKMVALKDQLDQQLAEIKAQQATREAAAEREKQAKRPEFLATGLVARMESLENIDYPIKFKLVDQHNRPLVLLQSNTYDLSQYVNKIVGVRGSKTYLKEFQIYLVSVDDIEVLE